MRLSHFQPRSWQAFGFKLALSLSPLFLLSPMAHAQASSAEQQFTIPAGPLSQALARFSSISGVLIAGDMQHVQGKQSAGLQGSYNAQDALNALLTGTGLVATKQPDGTYTLTAHDAENTLAPVTVSVTAPTTAASVVNYRYDDMARLQAQDTKELFRNEASVSVGGSIPINEKVYVRGVEETAMLVTVDGARQNNKVFHHNATTLIDPSLLKSASASAGVAAADDGPGAIGGSLKYETVDVDDLLIPGRDVGGFVEGRYASNGEVMTGSASLYGRKNGFEALGYAKHVDGDNYEDANGDDVRFTEPALVSGLAKVAYESEQAGRFELSHEIVNDDSQRPYRANFSGLSAGRPVPDSRNYDLTRENTVFNYSRIREQGLWNPELILAHNETELKTSENPLAAPTTTVVYTGVTESINATAKNTFYTELATITAGFDYYDDSAKFLYAPEPDLEEQGENTGAFVQFRQTLAERLSLSYGLRYDQHELTGTDGSTHDDEGVSTNVFGEFHINEYVSLNAGYADVWGGVALAENFILNGAWTYNDIKPINAHNHTFGVKAQRGAFYAQANRFETGIRDARTPTWGGGPHLVADFDIEGYDATIGYRAQRGEISLKYANIESEKDGTASSSYDGNYFTIPLGEIITLSGEVRPLSQWAFGLTTEVALDNDDLQKSGAGSEIEGYTVVDVYADYLPTENLSLRLGIDNLTNEEYSDRATYGQEFPTVNTLQEPGRSVEISARYNF